MKRFLILILALALVIAPAFAKKPKLFDPFSGLDPRQVETAAVGAISIPNTTDKSVDGTYSEICSGSLVAYDSDGNGLFLTARHCVWNSGDGEDSTVGLIPDEVVSFNGNLKGPYYQAELVEIAPNDDLALLRVINAESASRPIVTEVIEPEYQFESLVAGSPIENISFPLDMGKLEFHGSFVAGAFPHWTRLLQTYPQWKRTMPVDITIAHGSSGSPIFDSSTHKVIGVLVGTTGEGRLNIAEPVSVIEDILFHPEKNSPVVFVNSNFPKELFHLPSRNWDAERHPFIPDFGQL